jgi:hypothetical protein
MAAFLAKIMQSNMSNSLNQLNSRSVLEIARKKPMRAKGRAKIVWANNTREKYFFMNNLFLIVLGSKINILLIAFQGI